MTTQQIYGLFAMLTVAAIAGLIFYCIGLRTGRQVADDLCNELVQCNDTQRAALTDLGTQLRDTKRTLDAREGALSKLRQSLIEEQRDHGEVERGLLNRLASVCRLTAEDHAVLVAMAAKLGLAADTFAGFNAHDHAKASRLFQAQALDMADRIQKALANQQPHPDSELIEWLNTNAVHYIPDMSMVQLEMPTPQAAATTWPPHLRELLVAAIQQQKQDTITAGNVISQFMDDRTERAA